jgi:hypothetical protein
METLMAITTTLIATIATTPLIPWFQHAHPFTFQQKQKYHF